MNFLIRVCFCVLLFSLLGCVSKAPLRGQALAQCHATCMQHLEFCRQNCVDNCPNCSWNSTRQSAANFSKYVNERKVEGKKVMRELNSYRDPLQCRKVTCDCMSDLMACKQSCSGVIHKRLQAIPNCV